MKHAQCNDNVVPRVPLLRVEYRLMMNMMLGKAVVWVVVAVLCSLASTLAQDFQGLRDAMTPEELEAAGLDNLSPEQQQFLDGWLRQRFIVAA